VPSRRELIAQFIPDSPRVAHLVFTEVRVTDPSASLVATGSVVQRLG
jgi:hypothetical protein